MLKCILSINIDDLRMYKDNININLTILVMIILQVKDGGWHHTVIEVDTPKPYRLPILDIAAYDIGDSGEEFGIEIDRICFS